MNPESPDVTQRYEVSLRVWHPNLDPAQISIALSLMPRVSWAAGSPKARSGQTVGAVETFTYWSAVLEHDASIQLVDLLDEATRGLEARSEFLESVNSTGGRVQYFIGWFIDRSSGELLPYSLLRRLGALKIDLALDIYGLDDERGVGTGQSAPSGT
jgi:hypothetical protein